MNSKVDIGDIVRLSDPLYPYDPGPSDLGLVIEWMEPFAKTMEPHGVFKVLWSGEMEHLNHSDELSDDMWVSPEDLEVVFRASR